MKLKIVTGIFLISIIIANVLFWNYTYNTNKNDVQNSFDMGVQIGTESGNITGYVSGYDVGFQIGNEDGIVSGYAEGYVEGEATGYLVGESSGYAEGYPIGYAEGHVEGEATGYLQGLQDGAGSGYSIRDPSYQEMMEFITLDNTDQNTYSTNYVCYDFASDVSSNASLEGYRCGFVYIEFSDSGHAIVCFDTVDQGLIFIEPQDDNIVTLIVGQPYWDRTIYVAEYDDTIVKFVIIW